MSLSGEPVVVLGGPILLHDIAIRAFYGMNALGRQFKQEFLKLQIIMIFHSESKSWHCQTIAHPKFF